MSFLNALASDGLTVGLRLYNARYNHVSQADVYGADDPPPTGTAPAAEKETAGPRRVAPAPQTPEERAAGRAEARAQLTAEGSLGQLRQSYAEGAPAAQAAKTGENLAEEEAAGSGGQAPPASGSQAGPAKELSPEEKEQVAKMRQRDTEVRTHEQAHISAAGGMAGSPHYEYQTGPDGKKYAVGGEVSMRRGGSSDPEQAIKEAETVKRAATAPAEPSSQDRRVAADAAADITRLKAEKTQAEKEEKAGAAQNEDGGPADGQAAGGAGGGAEKPAVNGVSPHRQAAAAYSSVKFGAPNSAGRPLLARA